MSFLQRCSLDCDFCGSSFTDSNPTPPSTFLGDKLLVGTKQGSLLYYSVEPSADKDCKHNVQLLRYVKNFSKKPIQQMAVLADQELAIRLSDGILTLHDLVNPNFSLIKTLNKTKGASLFTLDIQVSEEGTLGGGGG